VIELPSRLAQERGQALVELIACLPMIVLVVLAIVQGMLALSASGSAERALERGRVAAALGRDPVAAARTGLAANARVRLEGRLLHVAVPVPRVVAAIPLPAAGASALLVG
jgi:TadE-like protein